jgi:hypothetical protein
LPAALAFQTGLDGFEDFRVAERQALDVRPIYIDDMERMHRVLLCQEIEVGA